MRRAKSIFLFAALIANPGLAACAVAGPGLSRDAVILNPDQASEMFVQCSRSAPMHDPGGWQPTSDQIRAFEAALPTALAADPDGRMLGRNPLENRKRQYIGFERGGRKLIYGNFFPDNDWIDPQWRSRPTRICDGGPDFFGAAYDVEAGRITHMAFNGSL